MKTGGFATLLIFGIVLYALGIGGIIGIAMIVIGAIGMVITAFTGKK